MSAKQVINDKLQGSVATYLRCGGVVYNQIKQGLLLSLRMKQFLKSGRSAKVSASTTSRRSFWSTMACRILAMCL